jgi:hypothetical protein
MTVLARESNPPTQSGPHGRRAAARVAALRDLSSGHEIPLAEDRRYVIGKGESCDIALPDPCVSRVHCVLERRNGTWFVRDSGSRNGTFLNDRRVECAELTPGTVLSVGAPTWSRSGRPTRVRTGFDRLIGRDPALRPRRAGRAGGRHRLQRPHPRRDRHRQGLVAQAIHETSRRARGRTSRSTAAPSRAS